MNIAIIPARGGSKRIPRKNLRPFAGRPVIEYAIQAARDSDVFDRIVVSTDDQQLADHALQFGAEVPFQRPRELADDHTPTVPVIRHAIQQLESTGAPVNLVCCLYPTAPFTTATDLQQTCQVLQSAAEVDFVFPVTTFDFPIFRALSWQADGSGHRLAPDRPQISETHTAETHAAEVPASGPIQMLWPEHELTRSQDLPEALHDAGQFYWGTRQAWLTVDRIYSARTTGWQIPRYRVQDLDTLEDWRRAEAMYRVLRADD